ncbi:DNA-directed RNA polymerase subunit delta [Effusibacillus pohliae]|uniref:DNA-directed RNA polymerase subunit delta n=1 Tax=Effusibacillus pohliae TaxID=232270 RepID=UPI0003741571|nr:DNA-directed RNA polymerase subunit delta [Effusibacillus pohliae]
MAEAASTLKQLSADEVKEMALVDLAYEILREVNKPLHYRDLMQEVANLRGMSEEDIQAVLGMLYTEINIDGRFLCIGNNTWGLKRWYPVDKTVEKSVAGKKFIRKDGDDDLYEDEDEDLYLEDELEEEEELDYDGDDEDADLDYDELDELDDEVDEFADDVTEEEEEIIEDEDEDY